jgi:hypothetical protein
LGVGGKEWEALLAWAAGDYNDLHEFDTSALVWTDLSSNQDSAPPPSRDTFGFTSDSGSGGGRLFVFGGWSVDRDSESGRRRGRVGSKQWKGMLKVPDERSRSFGT